MDDPPDPKGPDGPDNTIKPSRRKKGAPLPPITSKETDELKEVLKSKEVELNSLSETNRILHEKIRVMVDQAERLEETQQQLAKYKTENRRLNDIIKQKENAIEGLKNDHQLSIKQHAKTENKLKKTVLELEGKVSEQEEKDASNNEQDKFAVIEKNLNQQLEKIGESLRASISEEVNKVKLSNSILEDKINDAVKLNATYAGALTNVATVSNTETAVGNPNKTTPDFKAIIREQQNEDLAEESEQKRRACNIVVHGFPDSPNQAKELAEKHDGDFVTDLFKDMNVQIEYKSIFRLGTVKQDAENESRRPLKVILKNEDDKNRMMGNLRNLKGKEKYKSISITDDNTMKQRTLIKEYSEKAKRANELEDKDSKFIWRVRGTPKNGLKLMKLRKRNVMEPVQIE